MKHYTITGFDPYSHVNIKDHIGINVEGNIERLLDYSLGLLPDNTPSDELASIEICKNVFIEKLRDGKVKTHYQEIYWEVTCHENDGIWSSHGCGKTIEDIFVDY